MTVKIIPFPSTQREQGAKTPCSSLNFRHLICGDCKGNEFNIGVEENGPGSCVFTFIVCITCGNQIQVKENKPC